MSESTLLGASFRFISGLDSEPWSESNALNESTVSPRTSDPGPPQAPPGPPHGVHGMNRMESNESKIRAKARTFDSVDSSESTPGPKLMTRMDLKSASRPGLEMH